MSFDLLAPHYRWMECVLAGETLQRCRNAFLEKIANRKEVLVLGQGTGRCVAELLARNPSARVTCVDASARMLHYARAHLVRKKLWSEHVELLHRDLLTWKPPREKFDAIVSHFFLDCFTREQIDEIISKVAVSARPGAVWLIADFHEPSRGFAKWRARAILWVMYRFFRLSTGLPASHLTAPDSLLNQKGFELRERRFADWKLLHTDLWEKAG